jgi:hypothetical protein
MDESPDRNPDGPHGIRDANTFFSLIGALSAFALPLALLFLGGDEVTHRNAAGAYILSVAAILALFPALAAAGGWIRKRAPETARSLESAYVTLIVPVVCLLLTLTVSRVLSPAGYSAAVLSVHAAFLPIR